MAVDADLAALNFDVALRQVKVNLKSIGFGGDRLLEVGEGKRRHYIRGNHSYVLVPQARLIFNSYQPFRKLAIMRPLRYDLYKFDA